MLNKSTLLSRQKREHPVQATASGVHISVKTRTVEENQTLLLKSPKEHRSVRRSDNGILESERTHENEGPTPTLVFGPGPTPRISPLGTTLWLLAFVFSRISTCNSPRATRVPPGSLWERVAPITQERVSFSKKLSERLHNARSSYHSGQCCLPPSPLPACYSFRNHGLRALEHEDYILSVHPFSSPNRILLEQEGVLETIWFPVFALIL